MSQINVFVIEGNVVADAETRHFGTKGIETSFTIANNYGFGDYKKTVFINCKLYGERGPKICDYIRKGSHIIVTGPVFIDSYEKEGQKKYITYVKVEEISLDSKKQSPGTEAKQSYEKTSLNNYEHHDDIPF